MKWAFASLLAIFCSWCLMCSPTQAHLKLAQVELQMGTSFAGYAPKRIVVKFDESLL